MEAIILFAAGIYSVEFIGPTFGSTGEVAKYTRFLISRVHQGAL